MKLIHLQNYFRSTLPLAKNVTLAKNVRLSHADLNPFNLAPSYRRGNKPQIGSPFPQLVITNILPSPPLSPSPQKGEEEGLKPPSPCLGEGGLEDKGKASGINVSRNVGDGKLPQGEGLGVRAEKISNNYLPRTQIMEVMTDIWPEWRRQKLPLYLFLGLCLNLVLAPAVLAATGGDFSRTQAYWLAILGLVTVALAIYLFFVMFVPEKF
jgi:K+-transporting ATPase KdpF subunit